LVAKVVFGSMIVLEKTEHTQLLELGKKKAVVFFIAGFVDSPDLGARLGRLPQPRNRRFDRICVTCGSTKHYW
jgi:hypothetical protein